MMTQPQEQEHEALRRARALDAHGFCRAAIDVLEAALADDPDAGAVWALRAVLLHRARRYDEAFANVQQALALKPLAPDEMLVLADGYLRCGLTVSAADIYAALAARDDLGQLWPRVYAGLCGAKQWQAALTVCRRAAQQRPEDDGAYYAMAQVLARLGRPAETIVGVLGKAIDLNPDDPRYRVLLAIQLVRAGKPRDAYASLADLPIEAFADVECACCAWKLLRLCVSFGDAPRAAVFAAQLANLAAAAGSRRDDSEGAP